MRVSMHNVRAGLIDCYLKEDGRVYASASLGEDGKHWSIADLFFESSDAAQQVADQMEQLAAAMRNAEARQLKLQNTTQPGEGNALTNPAKR